MLDVHPVARFEFKSIGSAEDSVEDTDTAEDRLEAALERIARGVNAPDPVATEVADRLDHIIATLREALGK